MDKIVCISKLSIKPFYYYNLVRSFLFVSMNDKRNRKPNILLALLCIVVLSLALELMHPVPRPELTCLKHSSRHFLVTLIQPIFPQVPLGAPSPRSFFNSFFLNVFLQIVQVVIVQPQQVVNGKTSRNSPVGN